MRIGELSRRTGASVRLLRYYEEQGLIGSTRSASGQRHFTEDAVPAWSSFAASSRRGRPAVPSPR
ncbi:MerR family DNA-binding transcriptional regulator [Nocardiopsis exhalans]|uniref:MerR family DNA-binding transcriptional regulator n=1 Tax=Nocardiopsis exhalans TaxID=163604 RepID=UPI0031E3C1E0